MTDELYTPDYNWLVTSEYDQLHHATLTRERAKKCEELAGIYDGPVQFDCGRTATTALVPGLFSRGAFGAGLPRCPTCCDATGLPRGTGSPKNDDECRRILGLDGARPTRCPVHGMPDCSPLLNGCSRLTVPGGA